MIKKFILFKPLLARQRTNANGTGARNSRCGYIKINIIVNP